MNQSQAFDESGRRIPVTYIQAGPCWVTEVSDTSVQLGFGVIKNLRKPQEGHIKKAGLTTKLRFLRSFRLGDRGDLTLGKEIKAADVFAAGDKVKITGVSKGKGFAGVVKRHGFAGGPRTHGQSDRERAPGSIGQTTTPGRVYRGKRMAGRMGGQTQTTGRLSIVSVDNEKNIVTVKGLVPGAKNGLLILSKQ